MTHLPKNHPVRYLLESAANGSPLTAADLQLLDNADLPPSESLTAFADEIEQAGLVIAKVGATGARQPALELAQEQWQTLAASMTDNQRSVDTTEKATPPDTDIDSMVARIFNH
ncbi:MULTISPECIES: hypothetical protein [unclassified Rathayibacter]|uniref:hypothetical protein n=1 Tax=unclassified Rathayibacter TaxID=2609250 RepID=UPI00104B9053|nr:MULTISPECIES: hypothetical protein [unclassified Rathayibacter]TCL84809.1 hypothetical protein EDF49_102482 [Rathayibacter sp. PhB192]TCM30527.1 hypothetical protein EDF43_102482 [Rathayibacter sp. PhB179]